MAIQDYLERKLQELEQEIAQSEEVMGSLRERLARADEARRSEPDQYDKWNKIHHDLEQELSKLRAHLTACHADLELKRRRLKEFIENESAREQQLIELAQRIDQMSVEELSMLTAEDIAQLQEFELKHGAVTATASPIPPSAPPPPRAPAPAAPAVDLKAILTKLQHDGALSLSLLEIKGLLDMYERLVRKTDRDEREEHSRSYLQARLAEIEKFSITLLKSWRGLSA